MDIRLITSGEESACNEFHNRIHGHHRTLAQWRWEFARAGDNSPIPYAIVKDGNTVIGTQAFIPIRMIDRNGVYWTAKSEETLVDPNYRGQQLFEKMYDLLFQYAKEHQFAYIWGFSPAIKAFTRLGFATPGVTRQLFIPFSSRSVVAMLNKQRGDNAKTIASRIKTSAVYLSSVAAGIVSSAKIVFTNRRLPNGIEIRTMEQPDSQVGSLCERFIQQWGGTTIYRDSEYLRWRLFENPYVKSIVRGIYDGDRLLGWVAYTLGDDGLGYLVDIMVACDEQCHSSADLVRVLLLDAVIGTRNMGATGIRGWQVNRHPFDQLVCKVSRRIGFYHIKHGNSVVLYTCEAGKNKAQSGKFDDWYITRIYTEGVLS